MSSDEEMNVEKTRSRTEHDRRNEDLELLYPDNIVTIERTDPENPLSWSLTKKLVHTVAFGLTTFCAQFNVSIVAPATKQFQTQFGVGSEVATLCMSVYILGNALGPMMFAPLSEVYGRKIGVMVPAFVAAVFMLVIACVDSIAAVVVFRFVSGVFAAAPIVSSGGAMADMWTANQRAAALVLYAVCIVAGSSFSPIFGALLVETGPYGWRWGTWLAGIMMSLVSIGNFLCLSETYLPVLNMRRAKDLRLETGNWALHAKHEEWRFTLGEFMTVHCMRPLLMFATPIVLCMALYASFVYGVMFLVIASVGPTFNQAHGFTGAVAYLPMIANMIGFVCGGMCNIWNSKRYARIAKEIGRRPEPEERLVVMMFVAWCLPAGCFLYGWTLRASVHWIFPVIGIGLMGMGVATIFQGCLVYIVDAYTRYAASGIAANTFLRSIFGGVFPLFAMKMYNKLGIDWGGSLIGFIGIALLPIPWVFYFYGPRIRNASRFDALLK